MLQYHFCKSGNGRQDVFYRHITSLLYAVPRIPSLVAGTGCLEYQMHRAKDTKLEYCTSNSWRQAHIHLVKAYVCSILSCCTAYVRILAQS